MKSILYGICMFFVTVTIANPCLGNSEIEKNSHDFISKCFENIRPSEKSRIRPIFDKIQDNINPTLTKKETTLLKEWLDTKKEYIQLIDSALKINHLQFPPIDMSTMELPNFIEYRNVMGLLLIKVKIAIDGDNHTDSIKTILDVIKYGNMIRYGDKSSILTYMIGTAIEGTGLKWLQNALCTIKYENDILKNILIIIDNKPVLDKAFIKSMNGELNYFFIPSIVHIAQQIEPILTQLGINQKSVYDSNDSINLTKQKFQQITNNAKVPWSSRNKKYNPDSQENSETIPSELECFFYPSPENTDILNQFDINNVEHVMKWKEVERAAKGKINLLGKLLYFQSSPSFDLYYQRSVELRTKSNITRTIVALTIFQNNYGEYPELLNELVESKIINQVPLDLFSNLPLNYSLSDLKLWSVGSDEKNDNADTEKDIVFSCELSKKSHTKPCN